MRFFRREPLHWRLARQGGVGGDDREDLRPSWDKVGVHGVARPREWDAVVTVSAPGIEGEELGFTVLPDRTLRVDSDTASDLSVLADELETRLEPPYRAVAVARGHGVWAVAARRIQVATFVADGDDLTLTNLPDRRILLVDGTPAFGSIRALEEIGNREGESYAVRASRIDGDQWEVTADPL